MGGRLPLDINVEKTMEIIVLSSSYNMVLALEIIIIIIPHTFQYLLSFPQEKKFREDIVANHNDEH